MSASIAVSTKAKCFLSAYAIKYFPSSVFSMLGPTEMTLLKSAQLVLDEFQEVVETIQDAKTFAKISPELSMRFCGSVSQLLENFRKWQQADTLPLLTRTRSVLVALYTSYFMQSSDDDRLALKAQIVNIRKQLVVLRGQEALDQFDLELSVGQFGVPPIQKTQELELLDKDPSFFVLRNTMQAELAQNILLDINFKFTQEKKLESPIYVHVDLVRDNGMHWSEALLQLVTIPPKFDIVAQTFNDFKFKLQSIVKDSRINWVVETLDIGDVSRYGWSECVQRIFNIFKVLRKIQMPARDEEADEGWKAFESGIDSPEQMIEALKFIYKLLRTVVTDTNNMRILMVSHVYHLDGVNFVSKQFQTLFNSGKITHERTKAWVSASAKTCWEKDFITVGPISTEDVKKVLYYGFKQLLFNQAILNNEQEFPETLIFDVWKLCSLQRKFRVDIAAVCTANHVQWLLVNLGLGESDCRDAAMKCVINNFLAVTYGERVRMGFVVCIIICTQ